MPSLLNKLPGAHKVYRLKDFFIERLNLIVERLDELFVLESGLRSLMTDTAYLLQSSAQLIKMQANLQAELRYKPTIQTTEYGLLNPETGLINYLYSFLPSRVALDVGANVGEVTERLLETGYLVHAFEPFPPVYENLLKKLNGRQNFRAHNIALGREDSSLELHVAADRSGSNRYKDFTQFSSLTTHSMPADLVFTETVKVNVRSLSSLAARKEIPQEIGILKIDTEGYELPVIRGMGDLKPAVVLAEFWDVDFPFGASAAYNHLPSMVKEMRSRDYPWYIVLYRLYGSSDVCYYANRPESLPKSWGNVVFFQDFTLFSEAQRWCSAVLKLTYFSD
jgi:FkbM family methyltransferase